MMQENASGKSRQRLIDEYTEIARLAGALAHEIKSPLSTIRLTMEVLTEDLDQPETERERRTLNMARTVVTQCRRLESILNQFLMFAKAPAIKTAPSDLNAEVRSILDFYQEKAKQKNIEILTFLAPELPPIQLDKNAFGCVLWNLINNAEAAMKDGGQLLVRTYLVPDGVALDLIDNGCGMDAQTLEKLYDAFYTTKSNGFGLGLPTVRKIIEAHGAILEVQSELRRGTKFTMRFPAPAMIGSGKEDVLEQLRRELEEEERSDSESGSGVRMEIRSQDLE
ncbi:MAG: sensor histidine kinase [Thermoguttaceae bacterium]|nr:sensor histidine kinase [Thermoguttaceae bacterium]